MRFFHDSWDNKFKEPFGALTPNKECKISILVEGLKENYSIYLVVYKDGFWAKNDARYIYMEKVSDNMFTCRVSFKEIGYYFYYFEVKTNDNTIFIVKDKDSNKSVISENLFFKWQITVYDEKLDFLKTGFEDSAMYQIFPDSFYYEQLNIEKLPGDRIIVDTTYQIRVDEDQRKNIKNNKYYGGNLKGIIKKLDYLKKLGVGIIYLNPIFEAHSNHRYNTADFMNVDPLLGTNEDFCMLCEEAKKRDIFIVLDGVFNHVGADSIYFNKNKRYKDDPGAYNSKESKYYPFFEKSFYDYPTLYKGWWGDPINLVALDTISLDYIRFICGENGVIHTWLKRGAAGFRLDVIDELSNDLIDDICCSTRKYGGLIIIGEVWEDATSKFDEKGNRRRYLLGDQIDSVMNYPFLESSIEYVRDGKASNFYNTIMTILDHYPKHAINNLMNSLSTHDKERVRNRLAAEGKRNFTQEQMTISKKQLKLLFGIQYTYPGIPCIYYGDEKGMYGIGNLENRSYMKWENSETDLEETLARLADFRKNIHISSKEYRILSINEHFMIYKLYDKKEEYMVIVNITENEIPVDKMPYLDCFENSKIVLRLNSSKRKVIEPYDFIILRV